MLAAETAPTIADVDQGEGATLGEAVELIVAEVAAVPNVAAGAEKPPRPAAAVVVWIGTVNQERTWAADVGSGPSAPAPPTLAGVQSEIATPTSDLPAAATAGAGARWSVVLTAAYLRRVPRRRPDVAVR